MAITETKIGKVPKYQEDPETGEPDMTKTPTLVDEVEVRADGPDVMALKDVFKDLAWRKQNQRAKKRQKLGVMKITNPQGGVEEIFQNEEQRYREMGYGQKATRFGLVNPFGEQKVNTGGFRRVKYRYENGELVEYYRKEIN